MGWRSGSEIASGGWGGGCSSGGPSTTAKLLFSSWHHSLEVESVGLWETNEGQHGDGASKRPAKAGAHKMVLFP